MANQDDGHIHQRCLLSNFFKNSKTSINCLCFFLMSAENSVIGICQIITQNFI